MHGRSSQIKRTKTGDLELEQATTIARMPKYGWETHDGRYTASDMLMAPPPILKTLRYEAPPEGKWESLRIWFHSMAGIAL